jgi:hypothetical protein
MYCNLSRQDDHFLLPSGSMQSIILTMDPSPSTFLKHHFRHCLKGGLDANTEQMASISLGVKVGFEQKYAMRLMKALVTNAWHSFQLLQYGIEIESMHYTKVEQSIKQHGTFLKDFVSQLALSLIKSTDERMYYMDNMNAALDLPVLSFQQDESTLMEWLSQVKWPKRFKIKHFNKNRNLIESCLTCSNNIKHEVI